jgi:hypothetical protein
MNKKGLTFREQVEKKSVAKSLLREGSYECSQRHSTFTAKLGNIMHTRSTTFIDSSNTAVQPLKTQGKEIKRL